MCKCRVSGATAIILCATTQVLVEQQLGHGNVTGPEHCDICRDRKLIVPLTAARRSIRIAAIAPRMQTGARPPNVAALQRKRTAYECIDGALEDNLLASQFLAQRGICVCVREREKKKRMQSESSLRKGKNAERERTHANLLLHRTHLRSLQLPVLSWLGQRASPSH